MLNAAAALMLSTASPVEETVMLRAAGDPTLSIYHLPGPGPAVLYVHGATFPARLSIGYRIDGKSWADDLHARGFDVWSFDFPGYGGSGRAYWMGRGSQIHAEPPGRSFDAAYQIARVARFIKTQTGNSRISIIAHSWGTLPAGIFAQVHPKRVSKLVLFGPVAQRSQQRQTAPLEPYRLVSEADQWSSFQSGVPATQGSPIDPAEFRKWAASYLGTDPASGQRVPPSVEVPGGPDADFADAWSGQLPYDPSKLRAPTLIVRGEWDAITRDADAEWLKQKMTRVPGGVRDVKLPNGAHHMHLERNRQALFDAVGAFLAEQKQ